MLELELLQARVAAGETVRGRVERPDAGHAAVELVRIELSPIGARSYPVAHAELADDGSFALSVPEDAPPDIAGVDCALRYALRAFTSRDEVSAPLVVTL
ncbi:MAG TPA: hypothetical protein VGF46_08220 [Gaiellales bacterium]|jgi:hypothetical protein